jgi:hypothetical protein
MSNPSTEAVDPRPTTPLHGRYGSGGVEAYERFLQADRRWLERRIKELEARLAPEPAANGREKQPLWPSDSDRWGDPN